MVADKLLFIHYVRNDIFHHSNEVNEMPVLLRKSFFMLYYGEFILPYAKLWLLNDFKISALTQWTEGKQSV